MRGDGDTLLRSTDHEAAEHGRTIPITPHAPRRRSGTAEYATVQARTQVRRPVPALLVLALALAGAAALGLMGQVTGDRVFRGSWEFSRLGGPWLVAGFLGGSLGGWRRGWPGLALGLVAGAVIVGGGSIAYYVLSYWSGGNGAYQAAKLGIGWGAAGVGVGGFLGLLGASYATALARHHPARGGRPVASWLHGAALGALGGLLIGEAIALLWVWEGVNLRTMAALEGVGGLALVFAGSVGRSWRFWMAALALATLTAMVAPVATTLLRDALRTIGWAGA